MTKLQKKNGCSVRSSKEVRKLHSAPEWFKRYLRERPNTTVNTLLAQLNLFKLILINFNPKAIYKQ